MRRVSLENVQLGSKLAKTIYNSDGGVLLSSGKELSDSFIDKLARQGIREIYIEDDLSVDVNIRDVINEATRNEARNLVANLMANYQLSNTLEVEEIKIIVAKILEDLLAQKDILYNLTDIKSVDDYTFHHCVNVSVLSMITGASLGYDEDHLRELGTGAILHDIGKLFIKNDILKKPSQLSVDEFEEIKKHTILGYDLLKKNKNISLASSFIAFGHHERYDGSGYPLQLKGENIHMYARIAAVADVYDALTSDRVYRKRLRPSEVFEYITSLGIHHFDPQVLECFVKHVSIYPLGTGVLLNTGERALVTKVDRKLPTRPVVRVLGKTMGKFHEIDLAEKSHIFIVDGCDV